MNLINTLTSGIEFNLKFLFVDKLYQRIGEFVVSFQWIEHKIRQLGWAIEDPEMKIWPPTNLRKVNNQTLLNSVHDMYSDLVGTLNLEEKNERKIKFTGIINELHELRKYRNNLLHSAYTELKAGGEIYELLRSNPKFKTSNSAGKILDQELLTEVSINEAIKKLAIIGQKLNHVHIQLIHLMVGEK